MSDNGDQLRDALRRLEVQRAQLKLLLQLRLQIETKMEVHEEFSVVFFDTHIYETYDTIDVASGWLSGALADWLDINAQMMDALGHDALYRIELLPYPSTVTNKAKRQRLIDYIRLTLHVHLWHGVICPVYFVDPREMPSAASISENIFVAMPRSRVFISMPHFFRVEGSSRSPVEGSQAISALRDALAAIGLRGIEPIWLFYDENNFAGGEKLAGWRWESQRRFFHALYGNPIHCMLCHSVITDWHLDHIGPHALGFAQMLLNFQPLCSKCNHEKGTITLADPKTFPLYVPPSVKSERLTRIVEQPPPWLGRRRMKRTKATVTRWHRDLE